MQKIKKIQYAFFTLFCAGMILINVSCTQQISYTKEFYLPQWPPENSSSISENFSAFPEVESWSITVTTAESSENFSFNASANTQKISLELDNSAPVSILARPVTCGFQFFMPAGMIFPFENEFSWESGFSADCLKKFYLSASQANSKDAVKNYASRFNWQNFSSTIKEKSEKSGAFYNPWLLDQQSVLLSIENASFSATKLSQKKTCSINAAELFAEFPEYRIFSDYVPQNFCAKNESFTLSKQKINKFLLYENSKIITVSVQSNSSFSLAINSLPI